MNVQCYNYVVLLFEQQHNKEEWEYKFSKTGTQVRRNHGG